MVPFNFFSDKDKPKNSENNDNLSKHSLRFSQAKETIKYQQSKINHQNIDATKELANTTEQIKKTSLLEDKTKMILSTKAKTAMAAVREERWHGDLFCPYCKCTDIYELPPHLQLSPFNFRYQCKKCRSRFNDDTHTPFEMGIPSIETWMHCWFLLGTTDSLNYISSKLDLDVDTIKEMRETLKKIFGTSKPLNAMTNYDKWLKTTGSVHMPKIQDYISSVGGELTQADHAGIPKDTAEYRRQKERKNPSLK